MNRQAALSNMEELLKNSKEFSCVLVDIDNLKELNELRGYETGDLYLSAVANRLKKMERDYGAVASRYGGDEFLIVFPRAILQEDTGGVLSFDNRVRGNSLYESVRRSCLLGGQCQSEGGRYVRGDCT